MVTYTVLGNYDEVYEVLREDLLPYSKIVSGEIPGIPTKTTQLVMSWRTNQENHIFVNDYLRANPARGSPIIEIKPHKSRFSSEQTRVSIDDKVFEKLKPEVRELLVKRLTE